MPIILSEQDSGGRNWAPHPAGQFGAVCIDVIDLEMQQTQFGEKWQCQLRFYCGQVDEEDRPRWLTSKRFTVSMHEKANLRGFLKQWRGRDFSAKELKSFNLDSVIGAKAYVQVSHQQSKTNPDRQYASIDSIMKLPKGVDAPDGLDDYTRVCDREEDASQEPAPDPRGHSASAAEMERQMAVAEPPGRPESWGPAPDDDIPF